MKYTSHVLIASVALLLSGCATGSAVALNSTRTAISPASVQLYTEKPTQYEVVGLVEAMSKGGGSQQAKVNRAIEELKSQAAKLGANGVLIESMGDVPVGMVGNFNGGMMYAARVANKSISGKAIYVIKK